ncbi:MAG: hypothetical protein V3U62_07285 [Sedimenticolaceae bacterium]
MIIDWSVPISILLTIPIMLLVGITMERGLIRHFYKRTHAEQILVTFGLAIVLQEIIRSFFGPNPIPTPAPDIVVGSAAIGALFELGESVVYPWWRLIYLSFSIILVSSVVRLPPIHHLRYGGQGRNARQGNGRFAGY